MYDHTHLQLQRMDYVDLSHNLNENYWPRDWVEDMLSGLIDLLPYVFIVLINNLG